MDKNKITITKALGVLSIFFGLFWSAVLLIPFGAVVLMGWITDDKITNDLHWFIVYIIDRIGLVITFIFSILLVRAGFFYYLRNLIQEN